MKNKLLREIRRQKNGQKDGHPVTETIEFCQETGQIVGWCKTLRDLGMSDCKGDCDTCLCG